MSPLAKIWSWRHNDGITNSKLIFLKNLVNTNRHAKFGVFMTFGLEVKLGAFLPLLVQIVLAKLARKIGLNCA